MKSPKFSPVLLLAGMFLFMVIGGGYKLYEERRLETVQREASTVRGEVEEILALQKLWDSRGIKGKLQRLKSMVPPETVKTFHLKKRSIELRIEGVEGRKLNRFLVKMGALPLRIISLKIIRNDRRYTLECRCKW